jgi:hypothetical protein
LLILSLGTSRPTLRPIAPQHVQAGDHGMTPSVRVFASSRRTCDTREAALHLAGMQLLWEAGACPDQLLDDAGRPCLSNAAGGLADKLKHKRPLAPRAGGAGSCWKRQRADCQDVTSPGPKK